MSLLNFSTTFTNNSSVNFTFIPSDKKKCLILYSTYQSDLKDDLTGDAKAAIRLRHTLIQSLNFKPENIHVRSDLVPYSFFNSSGRRLLDIMFKFVEESEKGELLYIHLLGHGSFWITHLPDGKVETHYYYFTSDKKFISDDIFKSLIDQVPHGVNLTLTCDFCHSGGIVRGLQRQFDDPFPPNEMVIFGPKESYLPAFIKTMEVKKTPPCKPLIFLHSTHKFDLAFTCFLPRTPHGPEAISLQTYCMLGSIEEHSGNVVPSQLVDEIRHKVAGLITQRQIPGLSCSDSAARQSYFLGGNGDVNRGWRNLRKTEELNTNSKVVRIGGKGSMRRKRKAGKRGET